MTECDNYNCPRFFGCNPKSPLCDFGVVGARSLEQAQQKEHRLKRAVGQVVDDETAYGYHDGSPGQPPCETHRGEKLKKRRR